VEGETAAAALLLVLEAAAVVGAKAARASKPCCNPAGCWCNSNMQTGVACCNAAVNRQALIAAACEVRQHAMTCVVRYITASAMTTCFTANAHYYFNVYLCMACLLPPFRACRWCCMLLLFLTTLFVLLLHARCQILHGCETLHTCCLD